jgi:hypothetical protein
MTPFQALYDRPPPQIAKQLLPLEDNQQDLLPTATTAELAQQIKQNLLKAQERIKVCADKNMRTL